MGKKDSGKPKGAMTSYACFVQACRDEHKKKHPTEQIVFSEFSKKCSERWKVSGGGAQLFCDGLEQAAMHTFFGHHHGYSIAASCGGCCRSGRSLVLCDSPCCSAATVCQCVC